jgi:PKD repeat protein
MKKVFIVIFALFLNLMASGQGYYVDVCVNLTGPPVTTPITATLTYYANGLSDTSVVTINPTSTPYNFCFPTYIQIPDTSLFAIATGDVVLSSCGPAQAINYTQQISSSTTINLNIQNCAISTNCSTSLSQILGSTFIEATSTGVSPFTYSWDNGATYSGSNLFQLNNPGPYCVIVVDATGCTATDCFNYAPGTCQASISTTGSGPWTLSASGSGTPPLSFLWSDGSTGQSIVTSGPGTYCLTVTDAIGCVDTVCVTFNNPPICNVSIIQSLDSAGNVILVAIPDSSMLPMYTPVWSNGVQADYIYPTQPGQYCLQAVYFNGCYGNACFTFNPGNPVGGCSLYTTAFPDSNLLGFVNFTSFPTGTPPFSYQWLFSNGSTSNQANPTVNFGYYSGSVWGVVNVTDALGCNSSYSITTLLLNNNPNCNASFSMSANYQFGNAGEVFFQNQSFPVGNNTTYEWTFGDGDSSTAMNPVHVYNTAGYFNVCLTIYTGTGCNATWCTSIYVDPAWWNSNPFQGPCTAGFLMFPGTGLLNVVNTSQGNNLMFTWDFGNGMISNNPTPFISYNSPGTYLICLSILDTLSACTDSFCDTITVDSLGNVYRSPMSGNVGVRVSVSPQPNSLLSVNDDGLADKLNLLVLPNPSNGSFSLNFNSQQSDITKIEIVDIAGRLLFSNSMESGSGKNAIPFALNEWPDGTYLLRISNSSEISTTKLLIRK